MTATSTPATSATTISTPAAPTIATSTKSRIQMMMICGLTVSTIPFYSEMRSVREIFDSNFLGMDENKDFKYRCWTYASCCPYSLKFWSADSVKHEKEADKFILKHYSISRFWFAFIFDLCSFLFALFGGKKNCSWGKISFKSHIDDSKSLSFNFMIESMPEIKSNFTGMLRY